MEPRIDDRGQEVTGRAETVPDTTETPPSTKRTNQRVYFMIPAITATVVFWPGFTTRTSWIAHTDLFEAVPALLSSSICLALGLVSIFRYRRYTLVSGLVMGLVCTAIGVLVIVGMMYPFVKVLLR